MVNNDIWSFEWFFLGFEILRKDGYVDRGGCKDGDCNNLYWELLGLLL